jgi:predicted nucleotidyltransferase
MNPGDRGVLVRSRPRVSVLDFEPARIRAFLRERLTALAVAEAWLFGSVAAGTAGPWSDLDVVVVSPAAEPFIERPRRFFGLFDLGVPADVLVYTPEEYARLPETNPGFWREFCRSRERLV